MCGILGIFQTEKKSNERFRELVETGIKLLKHRGPDQNNTFFNEHIAFGHSRLSILDLDSGTQPMVSNSGNSIIVFNGEIYNYLELKNTLIKSGRSFNTKSDTEVILEGYETWGESVLEKLNGMFAFTIFDKKSCSIFSARDPYGQKPFFYSFKEKKFAFSSELRGVKHLIENKREFDYQALINFLAFESFYYDQTPYSDVRKLPPGHFLKLSDGKLTVKRYFENIPTSEAVSEYDAIEELKLRIMESVQISLRSDVTNGILLSGGLDSSLILGVTKKLGLSQELHSFSIKNSVGKMDESHYAKVMANFAGTKHHEVELDLNSLAKGAIKLFELVDEPIADPGTVPKFVLCESVKKEVKVAITGDGGDEFFFGYVIFLAQKILPFYKKVPDFIQTLASNFSNSFSDSFNYMPFSLMVKRFLRGFPGDDYKRNYLWSGSFKPEELIKLINPELQNSLQLPQYDYLKDIYSKCPSKDLMNQYAYLFQQTFLPDFILTNSDRASMLNSVELRAPFLDIPLTKYANSIPSKLKMNGIETKSILKKLAEDFIPKEVIYRKKIGFNMPVAHLIKNDLKDEITDTLSFDSIKKNDIFCSKFVNSLLNEHMSGKRNRYKEIWTLFALQNWLISNS